MSRVGGRQSSKRALYVLEEAVDDGVYRDAIGFRAVAKEDAVAERWVNQGLEVFGGDVEAAAEQGAGLGTQDQ
jgi:hypothetical protein